MASSRLLLSALRRSVLVAPSSPTPRVGGALWHANCFSRGLSALPDHKLLTMPRLSPTMEVGTIQEWKVAPGDSIAAGDVLAEIETDKATRSFEYQDDGFLAKIFVEEGQSDVPVGANLCIIVESKDDVSAFDTYDPPSAGQGKPTEPTAPPAEDKPAPARASVSATKTSPPQAPERVASAGTRVLASPAARKAAVEAGITLDSLSGVGTGPGGRLVAADVADASRAGGSILSRGVDSTAAEQTRQAGTAYSDVDASKFQRVAAERLTQSKQTVPHYYLTTECSVDQMLALRSALNAKAGESGPKLSVNDFVVKAAAAALRRVPDVNAQWMGDVIRKFHSADISVAVQTPNGLITPIVKDADRKGVRDISAEVKSLAERARAGKLAYEEFVGGTFTISNLGMYGVKEFSAIINPPQAAILAVGTSTKRVVPDTSAESGFAMQTIMTVTLSCDHRVVDGAVGAQWLAAFKSCMEDPVEMIL